MDSLLIKGGVPLRGEVTISGAKNAVLAPKMRDLKKQIAKKQAKAS